MPWEWWLSRLCEEFHCLPSQALREWETVPSGTLETMLECRAVLKAKSAYEAAQRMDSGPEKTRIMADPLVSLVREIEFDAVRERISDDGR